MPPEDEAQLVRQAAQGERAAFAALVERYWHWVYRWLCGWTRQPPLAEDLTQEAFLKAWRALPSFQPGASFRAWLFSIARNALLDSQRGPRGLPTRPLPAQTAAPSGDPAEAAEQNEGAALLEQAILRLPAHFREAFWLWSQDDLSFAEIAQVLGLTEETARWRVFKARLLLVKGLGSYLDSRLP